MVSDFSRTARRMLNAAVAGRPHVFQNHITEKYHPTPESAPFSFYPNH